MKESRKSMRGFASMTKERQREIASQGGTAAHQLGRAHTWSSEEAKEAGRKGALARKAKKAVRAPDWPKRG